VKIEDRILKASEVARIALVAPEATINVIEDYVVVDKTRVELPDTISDVVHCTNLRCVTNKEREPIRAKYEVVSRQPITLKCLYCWNMVEEEDIITQFCA
jgi:aspartate carbamoyltransferase regulatory subunit